VADAIFNPGEAESVMPVFDGRVRIVSHMCCSKFVAAIGSERI
jgi:hypothetical protein